MIAVLVADDHGIVRAGLVALLESEPDIRVSGQAADGREVLEILERSKPDVVILDVTMPKLGGLETLGRLRLAHAGVRVILLSVHGDPPFIENAVALGADGYVLKNGPASEILEAIRTVAAGGTYFSPPVARDVAERLRSTRRSADPRVQLSARELEVLQLISEGLSTREIAGQLSISVKTVEAHRTSLMRKLGVRKNTELVRYALRNGLVTP
ncbi:Oxygen regulatory protein NreC [Myxococcaceae bacterium]|jgi:DNA-binding NarL/FixJ family response regulator|nr:Oxygen regulatory protein NreC [Myxococcaceae bacterium]